ncbi:MAG TPA: hypothetical protein VJN22_03440 [Candidatus Eremiobacteraceae bacterium]|nr:hypothetical protein [Candidatus Eremiobacteraceae bacterium]
MRIPKAPVRTAGLFLLLSSLLMCAAPAQAASRVHAVQSAHVRPWVEGVDPALENALFEATYRALPEHNVLKVYAFSAGGYESAGIRFSARIPHEARDLTAHEIDHEAATLIRTAFDSFPDVEEVDVWGTIPIGLSQVKAVENTVFSVSASRDVYMQLEQQPTLSDEFFISAFGRVWIAPQVPR